MISAVHELQKAIASSSKPLSQLLRETKLIAAKLNLADVERWIDFELKGYPEEMDLPKYRRCHISRVEARHPYHGWRHLTNFNEEIRAFQPITEIENLSEAEELTIASPARLPMHDQLGRPLDWEQRIIIPGSAFKKIVEAVKNELLDWTIELEKRGILGENMQFDAKEKHAATHQTFNIQKFTGVFGNVTNSQISLYDYSSLHQVLKERNVPRNARNELEDIMDALKAASAKEKRALIQQGEAWISQHKKTLGDAADTISEALNLK